LDRRRFIAGSAAALSILGSNRAPVARAQQAGAKPQPFDAHMVRRLAREVAGQPFKKLDRSLPAPLRDLEYDAYRSIRFRPNLALWRDTDLPFHVQFFHRGFIFLDRIKISEVDNGQARAIPYSPRLFEFGTLKPPPETGEDDFAGFRLHAPMNRPDYFDEVGVFLGASYFRAVAKGQIYGLSARGLSIRTADPKGEEFPAFRTFWIERPRKQTNSIVVHALLDSESATAAFRFTIKPGQTTVYDVEMALYPRVEIAQVGIAPLTSMFFFDANDRVGVDDFRPAVHDSDGLAIRNGRGEDIWRPLSNPRDLQVSVLADVNPRGFGLFQRERDFRAYQDLESNFEKRPSLWIEPIGDWGEGAVHLVEIPTKEEIHDNITAFWRPQESLRAKGEYIFNYRMHWGHGKPNPSPLPQFVKTRTGAGPDDGRRFILELQGGTLDASQLDRFRAAVSADKGEVRNLVHQRNPMSGGARISFELATKKESAIELRAQLMQGEEPASEVWIYRWTAA
jgi:glucans biosynthesis protein